MHLTCNRAMFSAAFSLAASAVPSRTPRDVLKNVLLSVSANSVQLIGTDQEMGIRCLVNGVSTASDGEALLPTGRLSSILRELQDETFTLEIEDRNILLRTNSAKFRLTSEDPAEFPPVPAFTEWDFFRIPAAVFRTMIRRTSFATDTESTRYALGGVLVDLQPGKAVLAATDTRRLSVAEGQCTVHGEPPAPHMPVVPSKAMSLIEKILADDTSQAHLAIRANDMILRGGSATVYSRLVEGRFPRYQDVIPSTCSAKVEIPAEAFLSVVRQAQIVTSEDSRGVDFVFAPGVLTLISQASEIGESKVDLPIAYDGLPITITLDPVFVAEFLRSLDSATIVTVELVDSESAMVLKTADGAVYLVMPLSRDR